MMCYNVYMPLLLRLSNDVEENRGPSIFEIANPNNTVCADFSQGNLIKFSENAGKQCMAMSFFFNIIFCVKGEPLEGKGLILILTK